MVGATRHGLVALSGLLTRAPGPFAIDGFGGSGGLLRQGRARCRRSRDNVSKTGTVRKKTFFSPVSWALLVALLDSDGSENSDRLLALAHAAVEVEERAEAGDVGRRDPARRALDRDQ